MSESYTDLEKRCKQLEDRCRFLDELVSLNNIPTFTNLVDDFINENRTYYKRMVNHIMIIDHDPDCTEQIQRIIKYLDHMKSEFAKFL